MRKPKEQFAHDSIRSLGLYKQSFLSLTESNTGGTKTQNIQVSRLCSLPNKVSCNEVPGCGPSSISFVADYIEGLYHGTTKI